MSTPAAPALDLQPMPEAARRKRRRLSVVWLVPIVAGLIAAWLAITTLREQGPTISITFATADGLEAGKTKVKYKEIEIGLVDRLRLSDDRRHVLVTVRMAKEAEDFMTSGTRFWVVRPRVGTSGVSGLGTLVSGAYIELDPGAGASTTSFVGLEEPPPILSDTPGRKFLLHAETIGSLDRGAPIYYRGLEVGRVLEYRLDQDRRGFTATAFVDAPHDTLVRPTSRFWNASGLDLALGTDGITVDTESLHTIIAGGIAFDTPGIEAPGEPAAAGHAFPLHESRRRVDTPVYTRKVPYLVEFDGSVRGLRPGAPVEFGGIQVGTVTNVRLTFDAAEKRLRLPVTLDIEPERIGIENAGADAQPYVAMRALVRQGLRAQLQSGNLLTGELLIALDFRPDAPAAELVMREGMPPTIPSVATDLDTMKQSVNQVLAEIGKAPIRELVEDLRRTVQSLDRIVGSPEIQGAVTALGEAAENLQVVLRAAGREIGPVSESLRRTADRASGTLTSADAALASVQDLVGKKSGLPADIDAVLNELTRAARSIRVLADYLERHPEALVRGKQGGYRQ